MHKLILLLILFIPVSGFSKALPSEKIIKDFKASSIEKKSGAVILFKDIFHDVKKDGKDSGYFHTAIAVLDEKAVNDYGQIEIRYNAYYKSIKLDYAKIIHQDGSVQKVSPDAYQEQKSGQDQFYDNSKVIKFSLPGLQPGSIIEYRYSFSALKPQITGEWMKLQRFHYVQIIPDINWPRVDPTRYSRLEVKLPLSMPLKTLVRNAKNNEKYTKEKNSHTYVWSVENLPALKVENNMPSFDKLLPYVEASSVKNWNKINQWVTGLVKPSVEITPEISRIAENIKDKNSSKDARIKAVFDYVQDNIRYVYAHVDSNGYTPHKSKEVLSNKYGDCKDQSTLIVTLLKAMGIKAYPSLINTYPSDLNQGSLPTLSFDHMIVHVPDHSTHQWLDTSGETGAFPGISSQLDGEYAFILDEKKGKLQPLRHKSSNNVLYLVNYKYSDDSKI
ncbi:MAG: DUF3857 domain-containing transglutaminase family protein [Gammaproteobacteria bacterium]